jgi:hypothetical protein
MRVILLILFILFIGQVVVEYFFMMKSLDRYQISFIEKLHEKMIQKFNYIISDIFKEFEELFEKYEENEREHFFHGQRVANYISSLIIMILDDVILLIGILLQTCRECLKICRGVFSLIFLTISTILFIIYLIESITTKYKINFPDSQIYVYDEEFNKEIKNNLDMMVKRKIYMICFSVYLTLSAIAQITLIIRDMYLFKKNKNNINNNNAHPQISVYQETEREANNNQNTGNGEVQIYSRQNIIRNEQICIRNN